MRVTRRVMVVLVAGVLGWGGATGFAVAALADVGPRGAAGVAGTDGAPGQNGQDGADGKDSTVAGPRGPVGEQGPTGNAGAKGPAYQATTHTVFQRTGTGEYSGPTVTAEGGEQMAVRYSVACDSYFPFLRVVWDGDGLADYDSVMVDSGNYMSGTQYLNPTSGSGSFEIRTQDDCTWTVTVTQKY